VTDREPAEKTTRRLSLRHRLSAGLVGGLLAVPVAMTFDPYGIYAPEDHLSTTLLAAAAGSTVSALSAPILRLKGLGGRALSTISVLVVLVVCHGAGLSTMFSLAVGRNVLYFSLLLSVIIGAWSLYRNCRLAEAIIIALLPPLLLCTAQYALFLRGPNIDCNEVASRAGVSAVALWPNLGDTSLAGSVPYDVLGDDEEGIVFASLVDQRDRPGCGSLAAWGPELGPPLVMTDELRAPEASGAAQCRVTMRMRLDPKRNLLFVPAASYADTLDPRLLIYRYELTAGGGVGVSLVHSGPLPIDPSDMLLIDETLVVLGYPRRFGENSAGRLASIDISDPTKPQVERVVNFSPGGWMTEYAAPSVKDGLLYVTDVFGHLFEVQLKDFSTRRTVRPGASTLEAAVWDNVLLAAAPYARAVLQIDRESLSILGRLPAGNAMREIVTDPQRDRVFSTSYGDGSLYGWQLSEPGGASKKSGSLSLGSPLRGLDFLPRSGDLLVGSGCGVFRIDPEEALQL